MLTQATGAISSLFLIYIITSYLFFAIGLQKISEFRGHDKPWLAFIPIANYYLLGFVADDINSYENKRSNYQIILLVLAIISSIFKSIKNILKRNNFNTDNPEYLYFEIKIIVAIVSAIMLGFCFMVLYKIYSDYSPDKAIVMLVCSIIFYFIVPFVLFAIRRNSSVSIQKARDEEQQTQPPHPQQYYQTFPEQQNNSGEITNQF